MVGRSLGHYQIVELLGKGGMGEVYLAEDTRLRRRVALKVLLAELAADPERRVRASSGRRAPWRRSTTRTSSPSTRWKRPTGCRS